jgi:ComF family protein
MLTDQLIQRLNQTAMLRVDAILPVPLHPGRLRQRGFNQALELARPIARQYRLPLLLNHVKRVKNTLEQSSLSGKERKTNLRQAFSLVKGINYPAIAIVDDVMTTGSTVEELSGLLKKNGVNYVEIWCLARAGHDR